MIKRVDWLKLLVVCMVGFDLGLHFFQLFDKYFLTFYSSFSYNFFWCVYFSVVLLAVFNMRTVRGGVVA
jgi:hypothetical protein